MPAIASDNLASHLSEDDGDTIWERIIAAPRPKLEAFMKAAMAEGTSDFLVDHLFA